MTLNRAILSQLEQKRTYSMYTNIRTYSYVYYGVRKGKECESER